MALEVPAGACHAPLAANVDGAAQATLLWLSGVLPLVAPTTAVLLTCDIVVDSSHCAACQARCRCSACGFGREHGLAYVAKVARGVQSLRRYCAAGAAVRWAVRCLRCGFKSLDVTGSEQGKQWRLHCIVCLPHDHAMCMRTDEGRPAARCDTTVGSLTPGTAGGVPSLLAPETASEAVSVLNVDLGCMGGALHCRACEGCPPDGDAMANRVCMGHTTAATHRGANTVVLRPCVVVLETGHHPGTMRWSLCAGALLRRMSWWPHPARTASGRTTLPGCSASVRHHLAIAVRRAFVANRCCAGSGATPPLPLQAYMLLLRLSAYSPGILRWTARDAGEVSMLPQFGRRLRRCLHANDDSVVHGLLHELENVWAWGQFLSHLGGDRFASLQAWFDGLGVCARASQFKTGDVMASIVGVAHKPGSSKDSLGSAGQHGRRDHDGVAVAERTRLPRVILQRDEPLRSSILWQAGTQFYQRYWPALFGTKIVHM